MSEEKKTDNMELWKQVCVTDPAITKHVGTRGGFTAIDAQAQIKRATELWGSYGSAWGVKNCEYIDVNEKEMVVEVVLTAVFYYPDGEFEIATDMAFKKGNDSCKKLLTDLTTKALSKLGFNSDVFEGKFDDNKYVESLKNGNHEPEPITEEQVQKIFKLQEGKEITTEDFAKRLQKKFNVDNIDRLNTDQATQLINFLKAI